MNKSLLANTESVCPICLHTIPAMRVAEGDDIFLVKHCPEHGPFKTIIWRGLASYKRWGARGSRAARPLVTETSVGRGCPHDCGICPDHLQHSCCVLLEVTQRCNLRCPVCFAAAGKVEDEPTLAEIESWLCALQLHGSAVNIQLSGGEPTVRNDLPEIIGLVRQTGFDFVQLNTNGVRLARDAGYTRDLAKAGLDCIFLQFDGVSDAVYQHIRGSKLFDIKTQAIDHCKQAGLGVVLVPTLIPGINVGEIGAIISFALERVPTIRAVHFQPVSYFGRYPESPADSDRLTLPEVMRELESQTHGMIHALDFAPGSAENAYCSFSGKFYMGDDKRLRSASASACCTETPTCGCGTPVVGEDSQRARRVVAGQWAAERKSTALPVLSGINITSLDAFLTQRRHSFSISGMAFQDAWTLDLERLRECFIHVVSPDRRIIPFCAYNLTNSCGQALYRNTGAAQSVAKAESEPAGAAMP